MMNLFEHSKKAHDLLHNILMHHLIKRLLPYIIILLLSVYLIVYKSINKNFINVDRTVFSELAGYAKNCNSTVSIIYRKRQQDEWACMFYYHIACDKNGSCFDMARSTTSPAYHRDDCDEPLYKKLRGLNHETCIQITPDMVKKIYKNLLVYQEIGKSNLITKCVLFKDTLGEPILILARSGMEEDSSCSIEDDINFSKSLIINLFHKYFKAEITN